MQALLGDAEKRKQIHYTIYFVGLLALMVGVPLNKIVMSVSQFVLLGNWLLEGDYKRKLRVFIYSTPAVLLTILFGIHVIGLFYTSDLQYGFEDVRKKLPLVVLPLLISTGPQLKKEHKYWLVYFFTGSVILSSILSVLALNGYLSIPVNDIRDVSLFVSHIRFALMICLAILLSFNLIIVHPNKLNKIVHALIIIWLVWFLFILQSITGLIVLLVIGIGMGFLYSYKHTYSLYRLFISFVVTATLLSITGYLYYQINSYYKLKNKAQQEKVEILAKTSSGKKYYHDFTFNKSENGHIIWRNVCKEELCEEWNKKSKLNFDSLDKRGNPLFFTLLRFITSTGQNKDGDAVKRLSDEEIEAIESGVSNYTYLHKNPVAVRIHQIIWEVDNYMEGENPSNHSITQRFEYWQTAIRIIKSNLFFGVGTGDVKNAFEQEYEKMNSPLTKENRKRAHNQYLEIGVALGVVGLTIFLVCLMALVNYNKSIMFLSFYVMMLLSMLTEDTLETQAGVTFFSLFTCFFLFIYNPRISSSRSS